MRTPARLRPRLSTLALTLAVAAGLVSITPTTSEAVTTPGTIAGVVTDAATGGGLEGICIGLYRSDVGESVQGVPPSTNAAGEWSVSGLASGYYSAWFYDCSASGYRSESYGQDQWGEPALIELTDDAGASGIDAALVVSGQAGSDNGPGIAGTITLPSGYARDEVCATAFGAGADTWSSNRERVWLESDGPAEYRVSVPSGSYVLEFSDCASETYRVLYRSDVPGNTTLDPSQATPIAVTDATVAGIDVTLAAGNPLVGTIEDGAGAPIAGACLGLGADAFNSTYIDAMNGDTGAYQLAGLDGSHRLIVDDCANQRYFAQRLPVTLPRGVEAGDFDVVMEAGAQVSGDVRTPQGTLVGGACVDLFNTELGHNAHTWSETGEFVVGPVGLGWSELRAFACQTSPSPYYQAVEALEIVDVDPADGAPDDAVHDITLALGGALRFDHLDGARRCLSLSQSDGEHYIRFEQHLLHTAEYLTDGIEPGTYDFHAGCEEITETWSDVTIVAGTVLDLDTMESSEPGSPSGAVAGTLLRDADGAALTDVPVQLCNTSGYCRYQSTTSTGTFSFASVANGEHQLRFHIPGWTDPLVEPVTVAGEAVDVGDVRVPLPTGGVTGSLQRSSDSTAVSGAYVWMCPSTTTGACWNTTSDATGGFSFEGVGDGSYDLGISPPGDLNPVRRSLEVAGGAVTDLGVTPLSSPEPLPPDFEMNDETGGGVPQTVVGQPNTLTMPDACVAPVTFQVLQDGVVMEFVQDGNDVTQGTATVNPDGTFSAEFIVEFAGPAEVRIHGGDACDVSFSIYIDPSGHVLDENGDPIAGADVLLLRSEIEDGDYEAVPDGSTIMAPSNRTNPDVTDATGYFAWDVSAGWYKVRASAPGCVDPVEGDAFVETAALPVPPPQLNLELVLDCSDQSGGGGGGGGVGGGGTGAPAPYDGEGERGIDWACPGGATHTYTDVQDDAPHAPGIACTGRWRVFEGNGDGTFGPAANLTRGQLASATARAIEAATGEPLAAGSDRFSDDDGSVHEDAINALAEIGVVDGYDDDRYGLHDAIGRGQFAAILARAYTHVTGAAPGAGTDAFGDDDGTAHEDAIDALAALGILVGDSDGRVAPNGTLTRAQAASMAARFLDALVEAGEATPPAA